MLLKKILQKIIPVSLYSIRIELWQLYMQYCFIPYHRIVKKTGNPMGGQNGKEANSWAIIGPLSTRFVMDLLAHHLQRHGQKAVLLEQPPQRFVHNRYIVLIPQLYFRLPPPDKTFIYQLEQSVSSPWFSRGYKALLKEARGVLEYARTNVEFLRKLGLAESAIHYLPIGAKDNLSALPPADPTFDLVFYGDYQKAPRRQQLLGALDQHFSLKRVQNVFGDGIAAELRQAKFVVNIHFYEQAILEMVRIQECISLGIPVISETALDHEDYPELEGAVTFFQAGSEADMVRAVNTALGAIPDTPALLRSIQRSEQRFVLQFDRFFMAALGGDS